ncbi:LysM peptidoglycan-binding domain-containing protein [Halalkalibaculum sp. DA3122]|uniref:LysM peptidoglycan-binding domain-containing protein n=1 Tax=unclassified Halalkalibaculum TaxID=2964617 RepID=UPI0037541EB2
MFLTATVFTAEAQNRDSEVELEEVPIGKKLLPYNNPLQPVEMDFGDAGEPEARELDEFQKEIMNRIAGIYRLHVNAIEAQINNDPVNTEKNINNALSSIQSLLDEFPEVQSDKRFNELYRSVMTEYREFYGIEDSSREVEGEIFEIQEELFAENNDWMKEGYVLPENITVNETDVPLVQNRQVNRHLMYYTMRRPEVMEKWLQRSEKYFPMMRRIFREEGAPEELIHLSMIESGLNPRARSWASAVGMWQFIRATGSMYGLEVNFWVDERRDPEKATRAAARHLVDLYNIWGDWHLAMANYNISPRGLKRAIRAGGGIEDYWAAYDYLPRETRGYVPGFIAATMVAHNPVEFGFQTEYGESEYDYETVEVDPLMPLDQLAKAASITTEELKEYNPELLRWATPPGSRYSLKLPVGTKEEFQENYENIPREDRNRNIAMHTVQRGETLGHIARKYGTSVRALYETNDNLSNVIYPGQKLVVPLAPGSNEKLAVNRPTHQPRSSSASNTRSRAKAPANTTAVSYKVKKGDTVGHIAEWYDVRAWQIRGWNGISNYIHPGQTLTVYVPESKENYYRQVNEMPFDKKQSIEREQRSGKDVTQLYASAEGSSSNSGSSSGSTVYTVRQNDTLIEIANSFGVSVSQIRQLNNIQGSQIYVGQTLRIK